MLEFQPVPSQVPGEEVKSARFGNRIGYLHHEPATSAWYWTMTDVAGNPVDLSAGTYGSEEAARESLQTVLLMLGEPPDLATRSVALFDYGLEQAAFFISRVRRWLASRIRSRMMS